MALQFVYGTKNKVSLLSAQYHVANGELQQGAPLGLSVVRDPKTKEKMLLLFSAPGEHAWQAPVSQVSYVTQDDDKTAFRDERTGKTYVVRFATADERAKTLGHIGGPRVEGGKGKEEDDVEVLQWGAVVGEGGGGGDELDGLSESVAAVTQRVRELEQAYQSDFAVALTTETVSALWLATREVLEKHRVAPEAQEAVQRAMVSHAAQKNADRTPLQQQATLEEAKRETEAELQHLREAVAHAKFVAEARLHQGGKGGEGEKSEKKKKEEDDSDEDDGASERTAAARRGRGLVAAMAVEGTTDETSRTEGWLNSVGRGEKSRKMYGKTSGHYLYLFGAREDTYPASSLSLWGSKVGPATEAGAGQFAFEIWTPGSAAKKLVFGVASADEYNRWVYAISLVTGN